ncbi:metallophosphoesterase [Salinadaptatus halalkaliphilus]|uniref:Metallophosphoesterase n=1 Tax=Salinadaptatus halalkaliphilus TaxID=2419781 RepID=A0A4S3TMN2_9EURY|nr:metallophosphoesterase [Salinadaptatus halalkaliphilus]THE64880.1 metallophosphoesterase [Salinadaptatus halalkaliphilus]
MLTFGHIADTHLGHRQYGLKQREDDMVSSTRAAFQDMVEERETDAILLPGDLFHSRDLRPKVLHQTEQELDRVPDDVPVLVSRGNHDENLTPRDVTWLNYLHQRGQVVFLKADLNANPDMARFEPYDPDDPGEYAGFYDIETAECEGPVRVFGLQWRGAKTGQALQQVANGIQAANDEYGEPAWTVLLAHFGIEDEVPTLGGTVTHGELRDVKDVVDYLALGHIHKRYEPGGWIYNPGSPEAHNTREGRAEWEHGYYSVTLDAGRSEAGGDAIDFDAEHHPTKRRPYYRIELDVTAYESPGDLETAFQEHVRDKQAAMTEYCSQDEFTAQGEPREPIVDLRFTGTLQFSRGDFRTDELAAWVEEACGALYVQVNTGIRTANVQQLLSEIDEDEVFKDGQLNTAALEHRVFETIAKESIYDDHAADVADVLGNAHQMAQADEAVEDIRDSVSSARQELFPELTDDVVLDIEEDPFADAETGEETSGDVTGGDEADVETEAGEVVEQ